MTLVICPSPVKSRNFHVLRPSPSPRMTPCPLHGCRNGGFHPVKISPLFGLGLHNGESHVVVRTGSSQFGPKMWNDLHLGREFVGKIQSFDEKCGIEREEVERVNFGCRDEYMAFQLQLPRTIVDNVGVGRDLEGVLDSSSVLLTTDLVVEILHRLRFDEKEAFRFFTWAGKQEEYCHEYRVYNDIIDILSCTKYKAKQFRIVCDMLDYMKRNNKKSVPVEVLLTILRSFTEKYLTHVQKFTQKKRTRVKTQPEINAFNLLLDTLCKCSLVEDAESMFIKVKKKVKPNATTYTILFFGWCRERSPKRGMKILEEMIDEGFTPDNLTYNTVIDTFCKELMVDEAAEIFEFMKKQALPLSSPTAKTYSIMILAHVANDRIEDCFRVVDEMIKSGCLPDVSTYKELIEGMYLSGKVDETYRFLEETGKKGYPPDIVTYNCFLKVLCDNKKSEEAINLMVK
ncbi:Pentatricopeptide repeat-containing protein [Drosera capensis]